MENVFSPNGEQLRPQSRSKTLPAASFWSLRRFHDGYVFGGFKFLMYARKGLLVVRKRRLTFGTVLHLALSYIWHCPTFDTVLVVWQ